MINPKRQSEWEGMGVDLSSIFPGNQSAKSFSPRWDYSRGEPLCNDEFPSIGFVY
jgi:hypothetical protein